MLNHILNWLLHFLLSNIEYINRFITGDFKWTLLGGILGALAALVAVIATDFIKRTWAKNLVFVGLFAVLFCSFVWFGHQWADPHIKEFVAWYTTPLGEPMRIVTH